MVLREFGAAQYETVMDWPYRLIVRGIQIERQRVAAAQLMHLRLGAIADGMEQGKEYVRGQDDPLPTGREGYYRLERYSNMVTALERVAEPWNYTAERERVRRIEDSEAKWDALGRLLGGMQA